MRGLGDLARGDLFEGVEALAVGVEGVHEMHGEGMLVRDAGGGFEFANLLVEVG